MKLNVDMTLTDFTGKPLPSNNQPAPPPPGSTPPTTPEPPAPMLLAEVLTTVLMMAPAPGQSYTPDQQVKRYNLAFAIHKAKSEAPYEVEITAEEALMIKADLARAFAPIVAGRVIPLLDGK